MLVNTSRIFNVVNIMKDEYISILRKSRNFQKLENEGLFHKFVFFQNIKLFHIGYWFENINPNHRYLIYGKKKGETTYQKIGMVIRITYFSYFVGLCLALIKVIECWI